jgi:hypothetical protein
MKQVPVEEYPRQLKSAAPSYPLPEKLEKSAKKRSKKRADPTEIPPVPTSVTGHIGTSITSSSLPGEPCPLTMLSAIATSMMPVDVKLPSAAVAAPIEQVVHQQLTTEDSELSSNPDGNSITAYLPPVAIPQTEIPAIPSMISSQAPSPSPVKEAVEVMDVTLPIAATLMIVTESSLTDNVGVVEELNTGWVWTRNRAALQEFFHHCLNLPIINDLPYFTCS